MDGGSGVAKFLGLRTERQAPWDLVARTEKFGTAVFPSDAVYNAVNYGSPAVLHSMCAKPEEFGSSIEKCRKLTDRENGTLFFSHDTACYRDYKKSPESWAL